ncbi:TonB-dependent receptor [Flavivirga jejuensis]|uniref:isocitrate dehydrogenase (NADP(+)) n=1 Tax=Flavivirga jejuensis TaxID=870487 RepID=A0ABT8WJ01_9FLAO|nr:TonB-dependent receptor [Flavivirga jejuensis]MDO5973126.1 TonB-dependent receptor [Flavivirga jejuensis]
MSENLRTYKNNQKKLLFYLLFLLISPVLTAQTYTLSGSITDKSNGESLFGASIFLKGTTIGVVTNEYGFYSLSAPSGEYTLVVSYMGYTEINKELSLTENQKIDFEIVELTAQLDEVIVMAEEPERTNLRKPEMSVSKVNIKTVKKMPVVLGEVDVIKSLQTLPGVTNNGEGSAGFNIRGGAADQNLVLLDEAIIYNTSHLLGYFSIFNADAIKDMKLYKGGIPARFGGRTSSVLNVRQKEGNTKKIALTGGIGVISGRLAAEGPVFADRGSFLIAGRSSYAHLFLNTEAGENSANFYDLNLKTNYKLNKNNKLFLSGYFGRDAFNFGSSFKSSYGNLSGNLRWNHIFNNKLFSNLSIIYSKYDYDIRVVSNQLDWVSSINNYNLKYDFKYYLNNQYKLDFGVSGIYYDFDPGQIRPTSETSAVNPLSLDQKRAFERAFYVGIEHKLTNRLTALYGLRYSFFSRLGGQALVNYANNQPVVYNDELEVYQNGTTIGETNYNNDETIESYGNLEPRLALAYQLNESSSVKAGYSRTAQYIHLLSNTVSISPLDVWAPSGKYIKPQLSNQFAFGYFKNFKDKIYSLEVETYYKTTENRMDFIDGSNIIGQNTIETEILNGESRAYGLEFLLRKNEGDFTGWFAYTLSKSEQRTQGRNAREPGINNGNWYNTPHDRTHDFSLTGAYKLNEKWSFGGNLIFQTGRPVTYPNEQYSYEGQSIANYSDRNSDRLTPYHRLDISATYRPNEKRNRQWKGEWVFGIYNVYNRKNAAAISFGQNIETGVNEATRTAVFGIIPSVTYNFKF